MIAFDSHIPYYAQLKEIIRERVKSRIWPPGERLPSEAELCEMFGVSRTVVRQALADLAHEGLIKRRKGKGSIVVAPKISENLVQKLTGFYDDMVAQGHIPQTRVLSQRIVPASAEIAEHLSVGQGTPLIELVRLRSVDGLPLMVVTSYMPYALCPDLVNENLNDQSLYSFLETRYQLYIARARRTMQVVVATDELARMLAISRGAPLFRLESIGHLDDGRGVEYYFAYHRGDRSVFEVELIRPHENGAAG
jgi:GntR family transcriptional regulator